MPRASVHPLLCDRLYYVLLVVRAKEIYVNITLGIIEEVDDPHALLKAHTATTHTETLGLDVIAAGAIVGS